jgi:hypothetical protein
LNRYAFGSPGFIIPRSSLKHFSFGFEPDKSLNRLVALLGRSDPLTNPHLSLIYKKMPARIRRDLAGAIELPFERVTFDTVKAVSCVAPTEDRRDVQSWRVLTTRRLGA